jgi:hypothetical protein
MMAVMKRKTAALFLPRSAENRGHDGSGAGIRGEGH